MTGRDVQPAYSYFGQSPPPDYQVVLLSEVRAGLRLLFIVYRDKLGPYISLDGDSKVQSALGRDLLGSTVAAIPPAKRPHRRYPPRRSRTL